MTKHDFLSASDAASGWLNTVHCSIRLGISGNIDEAYHLLVPTSGHPSYNLLESFNQYVETLVELQDELAAVSDGNVSWDHGRGLSGIARSAAVYPHVWASAHEAAQEIARMTLEFLVMPLDGITIPNEQHAKASRLMAERGTALSLPLPEVALLQGRIRRERAKLGPSLTPALVAKSLNDPRDEWIYEQRRAGKSLMAIRLELEKNRNGWYKLDTLNAVSQAAKRYATRKNLPWPIEQE